MENATAEEIAVAKACSPRKEGFIRFQALEMLIGGYGEEEVARISDRAVRTIRQVMKNVVRGPRGYIWLPGGVVSKIKELFDTTMTEDGILLLGAAALEETGCVPGVPFTVLSSGPFFKVDSFLLLGELLKGEGFEFGAYGMRLFFEDFGKEIFNTIPEIDQRVKPNYLDALIERGEAGGQGILIVKRRELP